MGHLYDTRDKATPHEVVKGQTLTWIANHYKGKDGVPADLTWEELAFFNWATAEKAEVTRALCERIGSSEAQAVRNGAAPETLALDPAFGPATRTPIRIPKLWKSEELALDTEYEITVVRRTKASVIGIKDLDKWFIPGTETCDLSYAAMGDPACADEVDFEVYASNYCAIDAWNDGLPTFTALDDVPVFKSEKREKGETAIAGWLGLSNCAEGALSPAGHPLNVAFSPYTAVLRYAKPGKDKTARIDLDPFWVLFDEHDAPNLDSCKIKWSLKNAERLKIGFLQISNGDGDVIFAKGLDADEVAGGSFDWLAMDSTNTRITPLGMPYRVRIEAHRDIDEPEGLALAAMHTEVRLFVHPDTLPLNEPDYAAERDLISLDFSLADVYHKDNVLTGAADGSLWTKYALAEAGFHPGPVKDAAVNAHFTSALLEFQRSVPVHGGAPGNFARLALGPDTPATKLALANLAAERRRPWFGKPADPLDAVDFNWQPTNWDQTTVEFLTRLRDPANRMIVWVDDRNWYTDGAYWHQPFYDHRVLVNNHNLGRVHGADADFGGATAAGRGSFEHRDDRVDKDIRDVSRPWIPLQAEFRLLSKRDGLQKDNVPIETRDVEALAMRKAIGPLRVDWTFDEIETTGNVGGLGHLPVLDREIETLLGDLGGASSRTRIGLRWALDNRKATYVRKDVTKTSKYYNASEDEGGIRPTAADTYFDRAFGTGGESLAPWTTAPSDRDSVYCVVHDEIGQPGTELFPKRLGRAGIYFHPSRIAGDGYRIRAQVYFQEADSYKFPNVKTLAKRYPKYPQAHTVQFRLWRKSSIRAYIKWGTPDNWNAPALRAWGGYPPQGPIGFRSYYTACHVHIENELGLGHAQLDHPIATVFPNNLTYENLIMDTLEVGVHDHQIALQNDIQFSTTEVWPWAAHDNLGLPPSPAGAILDDAVGASTDEAFNLHVLLAFRFSLAMVQSVERETGRMRGHVLVEYESSGNPSWHRYRCATCRDTFWYPQRLPGALGGLVCPTPLCGGGLASLGASYTHPGTDCADGNFPGLNTPSCGFPVGVFWNFLGTADLWAHEIGHNRHFEHAAEAFGLPDRDIMHDNAVNPLPRVGDIAENERWDRACLMSYITGLGTYDAAGAGSDKPCFCFKCVLRNRGWRLQALGAQVPVPPGAVHD